MSFETLHKKILERHETIKKERNFKALNSALFALGAPQNFFKTAHVAGTNGKGSVCVMLAEILQSAGFKTGLFTSPHLISPCERIKINGRNISKKSFAAAIEKVLKAEKEPLNYFEILTAAAFYCFKKNKVDFAVIETGLGGLLDATNVITPEVSIITSIGYDHKEVLGKTLSRITAQKAGIIKPGVPCVCGAVPAAVKKIIIRTAKAKNAPLRFPRSPRYRPRLFGAAQRLNAALCEHAARLLGINEKFIRRGVEKAHIPARFEILKKGKRTIIVDGAHNPQAIKNLVKNLKEADIKNPQIIFAAMKDKDYGAMLKILSRDFKNIVLTPLPGPRAAATEDMARYAPARIMGLEECLKADWAAAVFTGSFYLAGSVLKTLRRSCFFAIIKPYKGVRR